MSLTLLERVARMSQTGRTLREQAHAMGFKASRYVRLRDQARRAGYNIPEERTVHRGGRPSPKFAAVLAEMDGPPCPVDGMHGRHSCLADKRAEDFIVRSSPGAVEVIVNAPGPRVAIG